MLRRVAACGPNGTFTQSSFSPSGFFGWVLGAGVEARLWDSNWIARLEYLHYDFGHTREGSTITNVTVGGTFAQNNTVGDQTIDVVRAGLSYKFGTDAVVARY
jgi:outer membrane immunogenic protein